MTIPFDYHFAKAGRCRFRQIHPVRHEPKPGSLANFRAQKRMVPQAGLEPALLSEQDFESSASTNSTTGATVDASNGRA
jgi:hypothetical protein